MSRRARGHVVDMAVAVVAAGWLVVVLVLTRDFSFWSDDLFLLEQAGSWGGLVEPYNDHLSLAILVVYRVSAAFGGFSYTPFMVAGAMCLVAAPVAFYATSRNLLGPPIAAALAMLLLWFPGVNLRPSSLNHFLVLVGAIACAAALNRGRRADGVLAGGLLLALCSAGGGVVVAGACALHNLLTRAHLRRWVVVVVPSAVWGAWRLAFASEIRGATTDAPLGRAVGAVRDLVLSPFYDASIDARPLAWALVLAFLAVGVLRLRGGLASAANYVAWSAASFGWAIALVHSRGVGADPGQFRYAYLSMGFALLAVVPREPSRLNFAAIQRPAFAVMVVLLALARGLAVGDDMRAFARGHAERGREADGTMLVLALGADVIPDDAPMSFYGIFGKHGTAGQVRAMLDRYGRPTRGPVDDLLVERGVVRVEHAGRRSGDCRPLTAPITTPGTPDHRFGVDREPPMRLWSDKPFTIDVRRYGHGWIEVAEVPENREVLLVLPALNDDEPWEVRARGACVT